MRDEIRETMLAQLIIDEVAARGPCTLVHATKMAAMRDAALADCRSDKSLMVHIFQNVLSDSRIEVVQKSEEGILLKYVENAQPEPEKDPLNPQWLQKLDLQKKNP